MPPYNDDDYDPTTPNDVDLSNDKLVRQLADKRAFWKRCDKRVCRRARHCAFAEPECQGLRTIYDRSIDNLFAAIRFERDLNRRLAGKQRPIKRVRWYGEEEDEFEGQEAFKDQEA